MKRMILLAGTCILCALALAQEFWCMPQKFYFRVREVAVIRFIGGGLFTGTSLPVRDDTLNGIIAFTPSGKAMDFSQYFAVSKSDSLPLPLPEEGTYTVTFNGTRNVPNAVSANPMHSADTQELVHHNLKTILQAGGAVSGQCTEPTTLPLDIIPAENPYAVVSGTKEAALLVRFRVWFMGRPLGNALVTTAWSNGAKGFLSDSLRTDKKGWVVFERHQGPFLVSCVHREFRSGGWEKYYGSLSFEFPHFQPGSVTR